VTGVVNPDVSRRYLFPSLATGRMETQLMVSLLFKVRCTDIAGGYSDCCKAVKNEQLTKIRLDRSKILLVDIYFTQGTPTGCGLVFRALQPPST
jgi:hypothetical protein